MKNCPFCNGRNDDSATECIDCKAKFSSQPSSNNNMVIFGIVLAAGGIGLMIYGNSENNNIGNQIMSLLGSGRTNPGTPWMIAGGVVIGIGVILMLIKLFSKK